MYLGMNVQKAALIFFYYWGAGIRRLPDFVPRANNLLNAIQSSFVWSSFQRCLSRMTSLVATLPRIIELTPLIFGFLEEGRMEPTDLYQLPQGNRPQRQRKKVESLSELRAWQVTFCPKINAANARGFIGCLQMEPIPPPIVEVWGGVKGQEFHKLFQVMFSIFSGFFSTPGLCYLQCELLQSSSSDFSDQRSPSG
jgi:hypothetical protein